MIKNVIVDGIGKITLQDEDYLASGGQADVFVKDNLALKIYHDKSQMLPLKKIEELNSITSKNVLKPQNIIYDKNTPVGYTMEFKKNATPFCKLFTKSFKISNNISVETINELIEKARKTIEEIHGAKCLIVDLNELNVLASARFTTPFFIDVDSYETPSFRATAIMESIRDRTVKNRKWTENSDWYSFAIVSFQMWTGIHPYKGRHPDYGLDEWAKRMENGVSIFAPGVTVPKMFNDFSSIPNNYLAWFKDLFVNNNRCPPPSIDESISILISVNLATQSAVSGIFTTNNVISLPEDILSVFDFLGTNYFVTRNAVYKGSTKLPAKTDGYEKVIVCDSGDVNPVICKMKNGMVEFETDNGIKICEICAKDMMYRNGCVYTIYGGKLMENSFTMLGSKVIHIPRQACGVLDNATQVFDGVLFQNFFGKIHVTLPNEKGKVCIMHIKELDGYRILSAAAYKNVCVVIGEKKGIYSRFYLTFDAKFANVMVRKINNVSYSEVNMAVMNTGVAILALDTEVEIFKDDNSRSVSNPPFDANMKLYNISGGLHYVDGKELKSITMGGK